MKLIRYQQLTILKKIILSVWKFYFIKTMISKSGSHLTAVDYQFALLAAVVATIAAHIAASSAAIIARAEAETAACVFSLSP